VKIIVAPEQDRNDEGIDEDEKKDRDRHPFHQVTIVGKAVAQHNSDARKDEPEATDNDEGTQTGPSEYTTFCKIPVAENE
jgi:hypothetical protein